MITYTKSFETLLEAEKFLDTLLLKDEFTIAKVANNGGDIYFIKPLKEESLGQEFEKVLQDNLWNLYEE
jgi:hypothetical protein